MSHDKSPYTPILSAARQEQLTALRTDVRRKLAGYRERRDQSAAVLFQHLAYLRLRDRKRAHELQRSANR